VLESVLPVLAMQSHISLAMNIIYYVIIIMYLNMCCSLNMYSGAIFIDI